MKQMRIGSWKFGGLTCTDCSDIIFIMPAHFCHENSEGGRIMGKESRMEIRIEEEVKESAQVVASSLGFTLSEYVCNLVDRDIKQREEEIALEARRFFDSMQEWSARCGKPVSELLNRVEDLARPSTPQKTAYEIALELEKDGMRQKDIAGVLNQKGYTYHDGGQFTLQRVWHLLNPNGVSERKSRLGQF